MARIRLVLGAAVFAAGIAVSAQAQESTQPSTMDKVKSWTQQKWNASKAEMQKDKVKWDICNQQATDQHLKGRQSWTFVYDCMKRS